jgi:3',5'-cyclic AMP phosphodiesterase CpdA
MVLDRSNVDAPRFEFVVLADTHYVLPEKANSGEFETRRFQTARIGEALHLARHLDPRFVLHLGDMVQEFPGTADFPEALRQAKEQIDAAGLVVHHVAGNHDVGDKPDPTTAAPWTTPEFLEHYHAHIGPSWFSFDEGGVHFVILNTSIMNAELSAAQEQWEWLEADLAANDEPRTVICFHIPLYLMSPGEPALGHYDNVAEPARSRLLALCEQHGVDLVLAGHSHFAFLNEHARLRLHVVPSTSTTRPGFSELFSSAAPPAQGHNDAEKLGIFLVRVYDDGFRMNFLRTQGVAATLVPPDGQRVLLPGTSAELTSSQLSVTLRHPLTNFAEIPITFPSAVRQPVRNDYPLLSLLELGATAVRIPGEELRDPQQSERHRLLRSHGFSTVATYLWGPSVPLVEQASAVHDGVDVFEVQVPGDGMPSAAALASIEQFAATFERPVALCQVTLAQLQSAQMHRRQRFGYKPAALAGLEEHLAAADARVARVVCHLESRDELWELIGGLTGEAPVTHRAIDVLVEVGLRGVAADAWLACEALVSFAAIERARVHVDTLVELDRTMDLRGGLLDRMCNPQASFRVLQTLNTVLHGRVVGGRIADVERMSFGVRARLADGGTLLLVLPGLERSGRPALDAALAELGQRATIRYDLATGRVTGATTVAVIPPASDPSEPFVLLAPVDG